MSGINVIITGYSKKFFEAHREEILLHKAAKDAFSNIEGPIPKIKELNEENEDLANFFGKYMKCPIPYLIYCGYNNEFDIMSKFGVSQEMAKNVSIKTKCGKSIHIWSINTFL